MEELTNFTKKKKKKKRYKTVPIKNLKKFSTISTWESLIKIKTRILHFWLIPRWNIYIVAFVSFFHATKTNRSRVCKWRNIILGTLDRSVDVWKRFEEKKKGKLTATRVLRASIRIVAGQASGEAVGCKLLDRSRVSILDYWPTINLIWLLLGPEGVWRMIRFSRFYVDFSRSVIPVQ